MRTFAMPDGAVVLAFTAPQIRAVYMMLTSDEPIKNAATRKAADEAMAVLLAALRLADDQRANRNFVK